MSELNKNYNKYNKKIQHYQWLASFGVGVDVVDDEGVVGSESHPTWNAPGHCPSSWIKNNVILQ